MIAKAIQRNVRVSAKKAKLVCSLVRGLTVKEAFRVLKNTPQKTAEYLNKLLASAVANAVNNHNMDGEKLYIHHVIANQGPSYKRLLIRARGRQDTMKRRTSHFVIEVSDNPQERSEQNYKLLKPRAHQHKYVKEKAKTKTTAIKVESKVFDDKGVVR